MHSLFIHDKVTMREGIIRSLEGKLEIFDDSQLFLFNIQENRIGEEDENFENETLLQDEDHQEYQNQPHLILSD